MISEVDSEEETKQALGTVLYHLNKVAASHSSVKDFVNIMAKVAKGSPEAVLQPVIVSMLFSIATVSSYEDQVNKSLSAIMQLQLIIIIVFS